MTHQNGIGKKGLCIAIILMIAMCFSSFFLWSGQRISGETGICLPSPNFWQLDPLISWISNTVLLGCIATGALLLNRHYNFIRSTEPVLPALFLVLAASNPWNDNYLSAATLICAVNLLCISVLFSAYKARNATQELFVIGTLLSVGSMCQYAFLPFIPAYIIAAIVMKSFRIKEFFAICMGIIAPYWVGLGLGLISLEQFQLPEITNLFTGFTETDELFLLILSIVFAMFIGVVLGLNNSMKLYAGNSRINAMNMTISIVGLTAGICILIDFNNMISYVTTLYFSVALQVANLCALWKLRKEWIVVAVPALLYVVLFVIMILS